MATFHCVICTPTGKLFDGDVHYASVPSEEGQFGVLRGPREACRHHGDGRPLHRQPRRVRDAEEGVPAVQGSDADVRRHVDRAGRLRRRARQDATGPPSRATPTTCASSSATFRRRTTHRTRPGSPSSSATWNGTSSSSPTWTRRAPSSQVLLKKLSLFEGRSALAGRPFICYDGKRKTQALETQQKHNTLRPTYVRGTTHCAGKSDTGHNTWHSFTCTTTRNTRCSTASRTSRTWCAARPTSTCRRWPSPTTA